jgi:hypothetical protein
MRQVRVKPRFNAAPGYQQDAASVQGYAQPAFVLAASLGLDLSLCGRMVPSIMQ